MIGFKRDRVHWKPTKFEKVIYHEDIDIRYDCHKCGFIGIGEAPTACPNCVGTKCMGSYMGTITGLVTGDPDIKKANDNLKVFGVTVLSANRGLLLPTTVAQS